MAANGKRSELLSPMDQAWLRMEDPTNLMMVTGVLTFDRPLSFERLRATLEHRLIGRFDRFRKRVVVANGMARWETDPNFTLSAHLHRIALPAPGDQGALQELISDLMSTPLDFTKPPWQYHLIENYGAGCVVLERLHHCIADGIALIHVLLSMTDDSPDAPWPAADDQQRAARSARGPIAAVNATVRSAEKLFSEGVEALFQPARLTDTAKLG
ncbi:MAG TPA: wax ester/triacylglycerol synthase domain-containing protein, partial [Roseiflexaceae bacterium]